MSDRAKQPGHSGDVGWQQQIREGCLSRGWDDGELARRAGISRSTLYYLRRGTTRHPRASTLNRIAQALGIDPRSLDHHSLDHHSLDHHSDDPAGNENIPTVDTTLQMENERRFDRLTNPLVDVVRQNAPQLFSGWNKADWDELYSVFGTGGGLTEEGVAKAAQQMNRRRETLWRLQIVMETHLAQVAERLVQTLFEMTRPQGNLAEPPPFDDLLSGLQPPANASADGDQLSPDP